ncbi:alpha-amylase, putative [Medicago truncatula]|uniref:Alpha-amylase, putative n=1 Tax=Medicago truncatula TaxID=3880 RepID=G7I3K5_MEDTR|nr:alpha-amylase, putative [Medicago truncatula]
MQFYDHFFDWGLKEQITNLTVIRQRNGINMQSIVNIQADQRWTLVLGNLIPTNFHVATSGQDYVY